MTAAEIALRCAIDQIPVFPCIATGPRRKQPHTPHGFRDACLDSTIISSWWALWPDALIGMPTGRASRRVVLDIDVKRPEANGFDSLEDLGHTLPETPMAHTASGGLHVYFDAGDRELRNSAGHLGPGLDVRGDGGYVILPSPGSGYYWDPQWNFDTVTPRPAPDWLWPSPASRPRISVPPILQTAGLSKYAEAALDATCNAILRAPAGQQETTLNIECFSIGTLAGAGGVPTELALKALLYTASKMPDHDPRWPWRYEEIDAKVRRAFKDGQAHPRRSEARRVG
jgi:Bifunctional DNA primase/polymerase, N-terminal